MGNVAYLLCAAGLHHADRMADERRCWQRGIVSKAGRIERGEEKRTDSTLTITLVDAEHSNVSPEVTLTMGRLLADDYPNGMRHALRICL